MPNNDISGYIKVYTVVSLYHESIYICLSSHVCLELSPLSQTSTYLPSLIINIYRFVPLCHESKQICLPCHDCLELSPLSHISTCLPSLEMKTCTFCMLHFEKSVSIKYKSKFYQCVNYFTCKTCSILYTKYYTVDS